jgi:enoyl-CoA hydratase
VSGPKPTIAVRQQGRVRRVVLDRPEKRNALSPAMLDELHAALDDAMADEGTSVVVLSGNGPSFCSGADLKAVQPTGHADAAGDLVRTRQRVEAWLRIFSLPKPIIAQVHGWCLGSANELLAGCDLVVCGTSARIGMPEARSFALPPTLGFWPARIGLARTKELLFSGRVLDGHEAVTWGLANDVVADDQLEAHVDALAASIAEVPVALLTVTKQAVNAWAEATAVRAAAFRGAEYHALYHQASQLADAVARHSG